MQTLLYTVCVYLICCLMSVLYDMKSFGILTVRVVLEIRVMILLTVSETFTLVVPYYEKALGTKLISYLACDLFCSGTRKVVVISL